MNATDSDKQKKLSLFSDTQTVALKDLVNTSVNKHQQAQHSAEQNCRQADRSDKAPY